MTVDVDRAFEKDTNRIRNKPLLDRVAGCIEEVQKAETIHQIRNIKKLKGGSVYYRIRIGDYRIDLHTVENHVLTFVRFLRRKRFTVISADPKEPTALHKLPHTVRACHFPAQQIAWQ